MTAQREATMAFPTTCELKVERAVLKDNQILWSYPRRSLIFGDKEPIVVLFGVFGPFWPLINVPVEVYIDGVYKTTANTDTAGWIHVLITNLGVGEHTVKCVWKGDWLHEPCGKEVTIRIVGMTEAKWTVFVSDTTVSPLDVKVKVETEAAKNEYGAVIEKCEVLYDKRKYILYGYVAPEATAQQAQVALVPPIVWIAVAVGILIVAAFTAWGIYQFIVAAIPRQCVCGICGEVFPSCGALRDHIMTAHPDAWEKIKDRWSCDECTTAPPPAISWIAIAAGAGIVIVAGLIIYKVVEAVTRRE